MVDHQLKYEVKSLFNAQIDQELDYLKGRVKKVSDIRVMINKKFETEFDFLQIRHRINKLLQKNFGNGSLDALNFIQLCEEQRRRIGPFLNIN